MKRLFSRFTGSAEECSMKTPLRAAASLTRSLSRIRPLWSRKAWMISGGGTSTTASPLFVNYALMNRFTPQGLLPLLKRKMNQPFLRIIPELEEGDTGAQEERFRECFSKARDAVALRQGGDH